MTEQMALLNPDLVGAARGWLSDFVLDRARLTAAVVGFGWEPSDAAPDTFERLSAEFDECLVSGRSLRVATVNAAPSIFSSVEANYAMRFWHDVTHVELSADFGFDGEARVAQSHLAHVVAAGQPMGSLAWQLLRIDTYGQNLVYAMTSGGFVADQWAFTRSALRCGLPFAVLEAVQQIEGRAVAGGDCQRLRALLEALP